MVLTEHIIGYKMPERILLSGKTFLELYRKEKGKATIQNRWDGGVVNRDVLQSLFRSTGTGDTGVVLSGDKFIYNILEFDKLPVRFNQKKEMVEWRLSKVFPGDPGEYDHQIVTLDRKSVLSVLLPAVIRQNTESSFQEADLKEIYIGNSFLEMCNMFSRSAPNSMMIELGDGYCVVGFGKPLTYVRKFNSPDLNSVIGELDRTAKHINKKIIDGEISELNIFDNSSGGASRITEYFSDQYGLKSTLLNREAFAGGLK